MSFKEGEIVKLKSGGPDMTMDGDRGSDGRIKCVWFDGATLNSSHFHEESVEYAKDGPSE